MVSPRVKRFSSPVKRDDWIHFLGELVQTRKYRVVLVDLIKILCEASSGFDGRV